ncbi:MAG: sulfatase-like hydrolase/transferase [Pirellulaceae bacterium]|nr:sulfatase-like hydrolase/transferase [Pirellulaceae bacterium]MDP7302651.1 sulfatase-like hydrolase/transferase [Pirellulaceae bacterium]HJN08421.1 sulfatase-like hydrolase/transferase [Pirellulaceae bacterium]
MKFRFEFNTAGGAITHRLYRGLAPSAVTLADVLRKAGYKTGMFGKWHLGTRIHLHPLSRGFDRFFGFLAGAHSFFPAKSEEPIYSTIMRGRTALNEPDYLTDAIAREAVRFIKQNRKAAFFAYVPFNAVHTPIEATEKYQQRFAGESNPKQRAYNAMTSALDDAVGSILSAVSENNLDDNTLVVFLNDNGGPIYTGVQSNGALRLGKLFLFEGGVRVPMLMRWNGVFQPGAVYDQTVSSLDLFPSICSAAGIRLPEQLSLDGVDLSPYVKGKKTGEPHHKLFWSNGPNRAMRMGNWKLVQSHDHVWLFDLGTDLGEKKNLSQSHPEVVKKMQRELDLWQAQMLAPAWPSKPKRRKVRTAGGVYELNI